MGMQQGAQPGGAAPNNGPIPGMPWLGGANLGSMQGPAVNVPAMYAAMAGMGGDPAAGGGGAPGMMPSMASRERAMLPGMQPPMGGGRPSFGGMQPPMGGGRPSFGGMQPPQLGTGGGAPHIGTMPGFGQAPPPGMQPPMGGALAKPALGRAQPGMMPPTGGGERFNPAGMQPPMGGGGVPQLGLMDALAQLQGGDPRRRRIPPDGSIAGPNRPRY